MSLDFTPNKGMGNQGRVGEDWWQVRFNIMDSDEAIKFTSDVMRHSTRPKYDWSVATRVFKQAYGEELPSDIFASASDLPKEYYEWLSERAANGNTASPVPDVNDGVCDFVKPNGERCKMKATFPDGKCRFHTAKKDA